MSEIIDALNRNFKNKDNNNDLIHEELTKTFFFSSKDKKKKRKIKLPKPPHLIAGIALVLLLLLVMSRVHINIEIRPRARIPKEVLLVKEGKPDKYVVGDISFFGGARKFSREREDMFVLVNSGSPGWANFSIELKEPMNMKERDISYIARGQIGDERLVLVLVDKNNASYRMGRDLSSSLTKDWQEYTIDLRHVGSAVDIANISTIKFEFGSLTTGNYPDATIFLKDIYTRRARDAKWQ